MRKTALLLAVLAIAAAGALSVFGAILAADFMEETGTDRVAETLAARGLGWTAVRADGLQVRLAGTAPSEAARFRALSTAGEVVDAARVVDAMKVRPARPIAAPRFTMEILRNGAEISLVGLVPASSRQREIAGQLRDLADGAKVSNLLESADYPAPDGWTAALDYALDALARLPRAKISLSPGKVTIAAVTEDRADRDILRADLASAAPESVETTIDISAPRPMIAPFALRFERDEEGARLTACSAASEAAAARIVAAAQAAGAPDGAECRLGLGQPSPDWPAAAERAIAALDELPDGGRVALSDADITLVAAEGTPRAPFDRVVRKLRGELPDPFSLDAVRPEPVQDTAAGPPEFVATDSPEGLVQLRGPVSDKLVEQSATSLARARFDAAKLRPAMRQASDLPPDWSGRVLTGIEALSHLDFGAATIGADSLKIRGTTGDRVARDKVAKLLAAKLGKDADFELSVSYDKALDPAANLPSPAECVSDLNAAVDESKIAFAPGEAEFAGSAGTVLDRLAEILNRCEDVDIKLEIGGHTDSQGREAMNAELSRERAEAVLQALVSRRVLTGDISVKGYGESLPIADNDTEEGRKANRRIEFRLVAEPGRPPPAQKRAAAGAAAEEGDGPD